MNETFYFKQSEGSVAVRVEPLLDLDGSSITSFERFQFVGMLSSLYNRASERQNFPLMYSKLFLHTESIPALPPLYRFHVGGDIFSFLGIEGFDQSVDLKKVNERLHYLMRMERKGNLTVASFHLGRLAH